MNNKTFFHQLNVGDRFVFDGHPYMKIETCENYFGTMNAIYMRGGFVGRLCSFTMGTEVFVSFAPAT